LAVALPNRSGSLTPYQRSVARVTLFTYQESYVVSDTSLILVVEDREDDILLIRKAFQRAGLQNPIHFVRSGDEAVAYLAGEWKYANRAEYPLPVLVLLDLKLPGMDGFEVLAWIRQQHGLRALPVVVLTSSSDLSDVNRAYQLGANSFFVKELEFRDTVELSRLLQNYWLAKVRTPQTSREHPKPAQPADSEGSTLQ
jgi:CheY-like chemotaxis protein